MKQLIYLIAMPLVFLAIAQHQYLPLTAKIMEMSEKGLSIRGTTAVQPERLPKTVPRITKVRNLQLSQTNRRPITNRS